MKVISIYCYLCRIFFEFSMPIGAYFCLPLMTAVLISVVFVLWQICSIPIVKAHNEYMKKLIEAATTKQCGDGK